MNAILVVNKPINYTSRDVVNKISKIFNEKKVGHTGTLDPIATGVLVVCLGKYTKLDLKLTSMEKEYIATMRLGLKTDTMDITGNVLKKESKNIPIKDIKEVFKSFPSQYEQTVPKYSAVKVNGKKLYEYARENIEVELPKRVVKIFSLELVSYENDLLTFKTKVSKGTYIRSLIEDIANRLGTIATMQSLIRTKQGKFNIENSYTLEQIENNDYKFLDIKDALGYEIIDGTNDKKKYLNGNKVEKKLKDGYYFIKIDGEIKSIYYFENKIGKQDIML